MMETPGALVEIVIGAGGGMGVRVVSGSGGVFRGRTAQRAWFSGCWHRGLPSYLQNIRLRLIQVKTESAIA